VNEEDAVTATIAIANGLIVRLTWPLTGRAEEMEAISTAIADPDSAGIVVFGAAGVGKSRIAREALAVAASHGAETRWATTLMCAVGPRSPGLREYADSVRVAWPLTGRREEMRTIEAAIADPEVAGTVVCGAAGVGKSRIVREALSAAASNGAEVRWAVATSSAKELPLATFAAWAESASTDSLQLVRGVIESLTAAPPDTRVVVGIDDAHLLDDLSAFVLHQIVQRGAAKVVMTVRDGEPIPAAIQEVWKGGQLDRLDLQPLSMDETASLLAATLDGPVETEAARRLWKLTRGNALYLRNIVEQELGDGRLAQREGYWQWSGDPVVPPGLAELIDSRMGALPDPVSDVIDLLAVGEPIALTSLARLTDPAAVEEADIRGLVALDDVDGHIEVRLAHPLYGEVRRNRAAATRLRRLRGLVAAELATSNDREDVQALVRRAALTLESDLEPDADLLVRAARGALWLTGLQSSINSASLLGERLAGAAIEAGAGAEAHFIRAYALSWLGNGVDADAVLTRMPTGELSDCDRARLVFLQALNRMFALADPPGAKRLIDDALRTTPPHARGCIEAIQMVYMAAMGEPDAVSEPLHQLDFECLPDIVAARVRSWALTVARGEAGRTTEAVAAAQAGYPVPIRSFVIIADAHVSALLLSGRVAEAPAVADLVRGRAGDARAMTQPFIAVIAAVAGRAALGEGRLHDAWSQLQDRVIENYPGTVNGWGYRCQISRTIALAIHGSVDEATAAGAALEQRRHPAWRYVEYEHELARAWVTAAQGTVSEAIRLTMSAAEIARTNGQFAAEVMCLQTAAQFGDPAGASRLRQLSSMVEGPRAALAARFAAALSDDDAAELAAVSEEFEKIGDLIAAIDAAAHAALVHRRADRKGSSLTCSSRADDLAHRCGASTPALCKASQRLPLSDREREIAMLIGAGLSTRAIADRLTLSVRTVEGHIYRAMAKTGAADRDELAAMLPSTHDSNKLIR
jgi:DNA-binding CsgD family transcriptional regulator